MKLFVLGSGSANHLVYSTRQRRISLVGNGFPQKFEITDADVGTVMWKLLSEKTSVEATMTALMDIYAVDEARLRHDLAILIEKLVAEKLITTQDD
ncbi:MAG: PqqD family protein [Anaerolineales bacterium]|nr:MAG: PqqD family protein [Anaerolineales bacterium]